MFTSRSWVTGAAVLLLAGAAAASGPGNGVCDDAIPTGIGTAMTSNCGAPSAAGVCDGVMIGQAVWYSFTAASAGLHQFDTKGSGFDTAISVFDACGGVVLACNDDTFGLDASVRLALTPGQQVKIAVGGAMGMVGTGAPCGEVRLNVSVGFDGCCSPWDNARYDGRNAQTSQLGFDRDWMRYARVTADDFWLCEGSVYRIRTMRAVMLTDAVAPKAQVAILPDCDGTPVNYPVAIADSLGVEVGGRPFAGCAMGSVEIRETGGMTSDGFRIIEVIATFPRLWLDGGVHWVVFAGYSGTADPDEQFFWGTSGNNVVKGRPGKFYDSLDQTWTDIDLLCCGCTDFNFCLEGERCKILLDNGLPRRIFMYGVPGLGGVSGGDAALQAPGGPSLQNGTRTSDKVRSADDFVVPPCTDLDLCYVEGYVLTNCDRVRMDIYDAACGRPSEAEPIFTMEATCVTDVGVTMTQAGPPPINPLRLLRAQFFDFKAIPLRAGRNYWISLYALGDNSQNARGYFLWNMGCGTMCRVNFEPGHTRGPAYGTSRWMPAVPGHDFAFLAAVYDANEPADVIAPPRPPCPADINGVDGLTLQDLFDFLAAWFAGCP